MVWQDCSSIKKIHYLGSEPIAAQYNVFDEKIYGEAILYVPVGTMNAFKSADPWSRFINIEEETYSGIEDVMNIDNRIPVEVFNLNGVKVGNSVENLAPGLYIVRQGNKIRKISVK